MSGKHKYVPRQIGTVIDTIHIVIGIAVTIMAIFAVFKPSSFMFLFPVIFLLAAVLSGVTGWYTLAAYQRNAKRKLAGAIYSIVAVLLVALFVISAVSIWGHN